MPATLVLTTILAIIATYFWARRRQLARAEFIRRYTFPKGLLNKLANARPELELKDRQLVARALRQYFLVYLRGGRKPISMPSQVVDELWHEFILYTRHYQQFCRKAFGGFFHHTPAVVLGGDRQRNAGLRRAWWFACKEENIDPRNATRLPLLFAIDAKLNIVNGFRYSLDCSRERRLDDTGMVYCAGDFESTRFDGTTDGFGDSEFGAGDSVADGCDSDGCGGD